MRSAGIAGIALSILLFFVIGAPSHVLANPPRLAQVWQTPQALEVPESVMYDAQRQILYVSNIAGNPTEKNGQGFISRVNLDGAIENLRWVTGLNAPKGMGLLRGTLYVTDIDRVHAINIAAGRIQKTWEAPQARFLNDIAIAPTGAVYISDMETNRLYTIRNDQLAVFISLQQHNPNGMLMENGRLLVGTDEGLCEVDTAAKSVTLLIDNAGGIDGLQLLSPGRYIVSDWVGRTQIIEQGKPAVPLLDTTDQKINSADLAFIADKRLLLIPTFFDNRVVAYRLE